MPEDLCVCGITGVLGMSSIFLSYSIFDKLSILLGQYIRIQVYTGVLIYLYGHTSLRIRV